MWILTLGYNINSVEVHPQLGYNRHPVDGALADAGSPWPWRPCCAIGGRRRGRGRFEQQGIPTFPPFFGIFSMVPAQEMLTRAGL